MLKLLLLVCLVRDVLGSFKSQAEMEDFKKHLQDYSDMVLPSTSATEVTLQFYIVRLIVEDDQSYPHFIAEMRMRYWLKSIIVIFNINASINVLQQKSLF